MNKLLVIYGCALLGSSPVAEPQESTVPLLRTNSESTRTVETSFTAINFNAEVIEDAPLYIMKFKVEEPSKLNLNEIEFIEEEEEIDLGFDTAAYLPEDFNPYEVYFDLNSIEYIETETDIDLGFDTSEYLPEGFNPYADPISVESINYIEEDEFDLGFDTAAYLPEGFSPYEVYFDVNSIEYIEEEEEIDLGFNTSKYLPEGFDPYADPVDLSSINYIDLDDLNDLCIESLFTILAYGQAR